MERVLCCDRARQGVQAPCWGAGSWECPRSVLGVIGSAHAPTIVKSQNFASTRYPGIEAFNAACMVMHYRTTATDDVK
jgi:hypothetical protein